MRTDITVKAEARASRGKNEARRIRMRGMIPAVVYGAFKDPVSVAVSPKELQNILRGKAGQNAIFDLAVDGGETTPVMVVDQQVDPVRGTTLHVDLKRIDLSKRLRVTVPVHTHGEPVGVKTFGGVFEAVTRSIELECLPDEIPQQFDMDVTHLNVNQSLRASDLPLSGSMKLLSPAEAVIVHVVAPRGEAAETTETATPTAEPEVIKKGKKEEEGAAADKDKGKKK